MFVAKHWQFWLLSLISLVFFGFGLWHLVSKRSKTEKRFRFQVGDWVDLKPYFHGLVYQTNQLPHLRNIAGVITECICSENTAVSYKEDYYCVQIEAAGTLQTFKKADIEDYFVRNKKRSLRKKGISLLPAPSHQQPA